MKNLLTIALLFDCLFQYEGTFMQNYVFHFMKNDNVYAALVIKSLTDREEGVWSSRTEYNEYSRFIKQILFIWTEIRNSNETRLNVKCNEI